jgi:acyl-CoA thioester hydrolase
MKGYPFEVPIQGRWRDLDAFAHVNNAIFASYLEVVRASFWREHLAEGRELDIPFFLARLEIDFKRPLGLDRQARIGIRVGRIGGSSFTFEYRVEADGAVMAEASSTQVMVDKSSGRPRQIEPTECAKLEAFRGPGHE